MKLARADSYVIKTNPPNMGGFLWFFIRLETDDGTVGWGETAILNCLHGMEAGYEAFAEGIFDTFLRGKDPLNREALFSLMYNGLTAQHSDYLAVGMISAFDIALWDICGKHFNAPVYDLLGGRHRDRIRTYTYIYDDACDGNLIDATHDWTRNPEGLARSARRIVDEGFTALKFDPLRQAWRGHLPTPPWDVSLEEFEHAEKAVAAIREAIGNRADICIGTHGQITPMTAIRLAKRLEPYDPIWLEEPCPPENFSEMARIARSTSIPVATGERLVTVHEFQKAFEAGACSIAQPDLGSCGGITAFKKIAALAEANYVQMAPHVWGGPIITAASLQVASTIPNFLILESIHKSRGFFDEIVKEPFDWQDGYLIPSTRPGIGIELDENKLESFRGKITDIFPRT